MSGELSESAEKLSAPAGSFDKLDFDASLLLSEPHAAAQATQRSVKDIQERLAVMVMRHSRAQGSQPDAATESPADVGPG